MTKSFTLNNSRSVIGFISGLKSRITPFHSRFTLFALSLCTLLLLGGFVTRAWGNTAPSNYSDVSLKSSRTWTGPHARFTLSGDNGNGVTNCVGVKADQTVTVDWDVDPGYSIRVTEMSFRVGYANLFGTVKFYINGTYFDKTGVTTGKDFTKTGLSLGNDDELTLKPDAGIDLYSVTITYTITPPTPTVSTYSVTVPVSVSGDIRTVNVADSFTVVDSHCRDSIKYVFTSNPNSAGVLTGSNFYAGKQGTYTIHTYIAAKTNCHNISANSGNLTIYVTRRTPILTLSSTTGEVDLTIDEESPNYFDLTSVASTYAGDGRSYSIVSSDISSYGHIDGNNFYATKKGDYTIRISSPQGDHYTGTFSDDATYREVTITVRGKATPTFTMNYSQATADALLVGDTIKNAFSFTNVSNDEDFTFATTAANMAVIKSGSDVITYDATNNWIVARNKGTATLQFSQEETSAYESASSSVFTFTVAKKSNTLKCAWNNGSAGDDWDENMNFDSKLPVKFSSSNTSGPAISVTPSPASAVATFKNGAGGANPDTIITNYREGTVTWTVSQAEDYKYVGDEVTCSVIVGTVPSPGCTIKLYDGDNTERKCSEFGDSRAVWSPAGKAVKLYFEAERTTLLSKSITPYEYVDGEWVTHDGWTVGSSLDRNSFKTFDKDLSANATAVKFSASSDDDVRVRNVYVTGVSYFNIDTIGGGAITKLNMPINTKGGNVTRAKFCVDYGTCADNIKLASDHPRIKFAASSSTTHSFSTGTNHHGRDTIELTYTSPADEGEDITATITIYTPYDHKTLTVKAISKGKLTTTLEYKGADSYSVDHANMNATDLFQVRDENGDLVASPTITLSSSNTSAINTVSSNRAIDFLCGGSATITASYAGDDTYAAADNIDTLITVNKLNDTVTWNRLDTTDHLYHVWAGGSTLPSSLASVHSTSGVTYTTGDATKLYVDGSGNLRSAKKGRVRLTASSTGDCNYDTISCDTIVVVEPCYHSIVWDQNFLGFVTASDGTISEVVDLTAYAVDSLGSRTYIPVHYWLSTDSIGYISGSRLTLNHYGTAKIAAITAEHDTFATVTDTLTIRIRKYGEPCESYALNVSQEYHFNTYLTSGTYCEFEITAPADSLSCQVHKLASGTITTTNAWLQGWSKLANDWVSLKQIYKEVDNKQWTNLGYKFTEEQSTDITKIRYYNPTETYSKYVRNQLITQKKYFRANKTRINRGSGNEVSVNTFYSDTIEVSFSDVPLINYRYTGSHLTLSPLQEVNNDCGDYDTYKFVLSGRFPKTQAERTDTIYFTTSALDTIRIPVTMQVVFNGTYILPVSTEGTWSVINQQWRQGGDVAVTKPDGASEISVRGTLIIDTIAEVQHVDLVTGGKIIIKPGAGLTVGANGIAGGTTSSLILEAGDGTGGTIKGKTGYLRISPTYADTMPNITIELYSKAYYDRSGSGDNVAAWQCVGAPISDAGVAAKSVYTNSWIYSWDEEKDDWVNNRKTLTFTPFVGYITTQYKNDNGMKLTYEGRVVSGRESRVINLAYSGEGKGHNLLANSYAAPIDISRFSPDDFYRATPTIYIQNAGTKTQSEAQMGGTSAEKAAAPGQYLAIPVNTAASLASTYGYPIMIPAMQGFWVDATGDDATITLNYERLVWNANYDTHPNAPMRAPKRLSTADEDEVELEEMPQTGSLQISLEANGWYDNIFMLESESYETAYEAGSDAIKKESGNLNVFTLSSDDQQLSIDATNSIIGTRVGVRTGEETAYTFTFSYVQGEQEWALYDVETEQMIDITDGNTYTFFAEPNTTISGRFMIVESDSAQKPAVTTGLDNAETETKVHKFVKDNNLYILKSGIIYDAMGARVR